MGNIGCNCKNTKCELPLTVDIPKKKFKKILVVDDVKIMGDVIYEYFQIANKAIKVLYAQNGAEAIQLVQEHTDIDIVWMDIVMQPLNGYDTTIAILKINPLMTVVGLTGMVDELSRQKCKEAGMNAVCIKPVHFETLSNIMEQLNYTI